VSEREREGEAGPCGTDEPKEGVGPSDEHGPHAGEGKEKGWRVLFGVEEGRWAAWAAGENRGEVGWKRIKGRRFGFSFFPFKPFQTFQIFKFKLFSKFKHFKPFSKFSKQFKNI
jgi:hypothetical protein